MQSTCCLNSSEVTGAACLMEAKEARVLNNGVVWLWLKLLFEIPFQIPCGMLIDFSQVI